MAERAAVQYETAAGNDYLQHEGTYRGFLQLIKWVVGAVVVALILMALFLV